MKIDISVTDSYVIINGETYTYPELLSKLVGQTDGQQGKVITFYEPANKNYNHQVDEINVEQDKMTIIGSGFGNGPAVILDDHFDYGENGISISQNDWSEFGTNKPVYSDLSHSGKHSMKVYDEARGMLQVKKKFPKVSELFISYWVRIPQGNGLLFPGTYWWNPDDDSQWQKGFDWALPRTFSKDSSFKMAWILQDSIHYGDAANLCLPSHVGSGKFTIGGNDNQVTYLNGRGDDWWGWDSWNRISVWIRGNELDLTDAGDLIFQALNKEKGLTEQRFVEPIFDADGIDEKYFNSINFPGWVRPGSHSEILYDDVYMAIGVGSISRVEVGDASIHADCTELEILPFSDWQDDEIVISKRVSGYLYITDVNGHTNKEGYLVM